MTVPPDAEGGMGPGPSSEEKRRLLRERLAREVARTRTEPASFAQERLWFLDRMEPGNALYNIARALPLRGPLDVPALERALGELVRRHESLRTTFAEREGAVVQVVAPFRGFDLPVEDLTVLDAAARDETVRRRAGEEAQHAFDLGAGPLFRASLLRLAADEHVLLLCIHHMVADGWSVGVLYRELSTLYAAFRAGLASPLPELPVQYAGFAAWQRERLRGPVLERHLAYWRAHLAGAPALLELPTDRPRPAAQSHRGAREPIHLPRAAVQPLRALAAAEGATEFMALLAAFQVLLARYAGTDDVVVGTPVAGRTHRGVEGLIGLFVNTLPLRTELGGDPGFREVLRRVRTATLGAYEHQELPFERLVAELQPERSLGHAPLVQVVLTFLNLEPAPLALEGVDAAGGGTLAQGQALVASSAAPTPAKFDLSLYLGDAPDGGLNGVVEYGTDLWDRDTILRMVGHLGRVMEQAGADPDRRIGAIDLLTDAERRALLDDANRVDAVEGVDAVHPVDSVDSVDADGATLHGRFAAQARRTPDAVALCFEDERISYAELERRANRLAHALRARGVGPETRVAVLAERSVELVVALLGVLKAGGAYVPLDPAYPRERLAYTVADSGAAVVLAQRALAELAAELIAPGGSSGSSGSEGSEGSEGPAPGIVWLEVASAATEGVHGADADAAPASGAGAEHLAYIIYTSGSTGRPKGVEVPHGNVIRLFTATQPWFGFGAEDVWTLFHSFAFDFSVWELWGALLYGGRLVVVPYETSRAPEAFHRLLVREGVTVLNQTPSAFAQLVRADADAPERAEGLRLVVFGGEALEPSLLRPWFQRHGDDRPRLVNMYGITETTVHVTYRPIRRADAEAGSSPIGVRIPDLRTYVADAHGNPSPLGIPGELYVGGAGVARGYRGRPGLTAERFVPDPFGTAPGARGYRSGDRVRLRAAGELEYLGRVDQQVKVRGFRIEPGEIEAALREHPAVAECVVAARGDGAGGSRLVGYVVPRAGAPSVGELRGHLGARLPEHMVPAAFVILPALPLTPSGKVDRRSLPEPEGRPELASAYMPSRTPAEAALCDVWRQVLRVDRIGIHDNFFELGGDSILAIRLIGLARDAGVELALKDVFRRQTVAQLAAELESAGGASASPASAPFALLSPADRARLPADVEDAYPLAQLQAGMLYQMERAPGSPVYHNVSSFHLRTAWDEDAFRAAIEAVVARHPVLRTSFDLQRYSEPLQLVHRAVPVPLRVEDLRELDAEARERAVEAFFRAERDTPFGHGAAPLLRFAVHRRTADTLQLTVTDSHAILDGWSVSATVAEVFERYFARLDGLHVPGDPPAVSYGDFVALERRALASAADRAFWERSLAALPHAALPRRTSTAGIEAEPGVRQRIVQLDPEVEAGLRRAAEAASVPLKSVLLAAHLKVLGLVTGERTVVTGLTANGRPEARGGEDVRGLFLNLLPLPVDLAAGAAWRDLARAAFEAEIELLPHRRYPLAALQQLRGGERVFEALFNYVDFHRFGDVVRTGRMEVLPGKRVAGETELPLAATFGVDQATGRLSLAIDCDAALLDPALVAGIAGGYERVLRALAADPGAPHDAADLLAPAERARVLGAWSRTDAPPPPETLIHELFTAQARRAPGAVALVYGPDRITYAQLDARADRLAQGLRAMGVGPEVRVGVCADRSPLMVAGVLAVLKAGGVYVPLDPDYPLERLRYVVDDARVEVILARRPLQSLARQLAAPADGADRADRTDPADWTDRAEAADAADVADRTGGRAAERAGVDASGTGRRIAWLDEDRTAASASSAAAASASSSPAVGAAADAGPPRSGVQPDNAAYVIYTSGSTGRPKGVVAHHRGACNLAQAQAAAFGVRAESRVLQFAPLGFDASVSELLMAWAAGAALVVASSDELLPGPWLLDLLRDQRVTHVTLPPSALAAMEPAPLPSLETVIAAGERLPAHAAVRWSAGRRLFNAYGPTEVTVCATLHPFTGDANGAVPIGRPIANARVYVLDGRGHPVAAGVPGELYAAGAGVTRGYLDRPELTAERYVPDPFGGVPGARMYRTGDRARWLSSGELEFLGRVDEQVKVRGFRIEPGEIEAALREHPGIAECAVGARGTAPDVRLLAWIVPRGAVPRGAVPSAAELREHLRGRLPDYMVPGAFVVLARLPLSPSGKVDRAALPEPDAAAAQERAYTPPRTETEALLCGIWAEVLGVECVGIHDDFLELGGDSLLALRAAARIREALGRDLPMALLFEAPTVAQYAARAESAAPAPPAAPPAGIARAPRQRSGARPSA